MSNSISSTLLAPLSSAGLSVMVAVLGIWGLLTGPRLAAATPPIEITVTKATFGIGKRVADVTARVNEMLRAPARSVSVNKQGLLIDPAPYKSKVLTLTYKYKGATFNYTAKGGLTLTYQRLIDHAEGRAPVAASVNTETGPQILTDVEMGGIVMIEGDKGVGSGFLAKIRDVECVVTNLHVLGDNEKFKIKNLDGEIIAVSAQGILGAVGADIAMLKLTVPTGEPPALVLAENVLQSSKIGGKVVVVGNRLGGGVATQTTGQIKGIGPARIEVNAAFQSGNSGSPIYDMESKQVIGVAAFMNSVALDGLGNPAKSSGLVLKRETRWFGYRLDTVSRWEPIEWNKWRSQFKRVADYRETSIAILDVTRGGFSNAKTNPGLRKIIDAYQESIRPGASGKDAGVKAARTLFAQLRAFAQSSSQDLGNGDFYDYFTTCPYWESNAIQQTKFREELIKGIGEIEKDIQSFMRRK